MEGKNASSHSSLRETFSTATSTQQKLGPSHQDDQHLRDVLKNEP